MIYGVPVWFVEIIKKVYRRVMFISWLTNAPFIGRMIEYFLFRGDEITYLPKDRVIQVDQHLEQGVEIVLPSQIVEKFIKESKHIFLMNSCPCRTSQECEEYPIELGCIFMGEATLNIASHMGRMVSVDEALKHLKKCREAGLVHMIGRQRLDAVWLNAWPVEKLLSVCKCCPCCCLYRTLQNINPSISTKVKKLSGVEVTVTEDCVGCGTCYDAGCFEDAISLVDGKAVINEQCRGCGRCVEICPENAISISLTDSEFYSKTVAKVSQLVDLT